jgi:hypothetical protein
MIQITNVSPYKWALSTSYAGSRGTPLYFNLSPISKPPKNTEVILKENLKNYGSGVKQAIADGVASGIIVVQELDGAHVANDRTIFDLGGFTAHNLPTLYAAGNLFKSVYNAHELSTAFHTAAGALPITSPDATDVATLITLLTEARTDYNTHIGTAIHPNPDGTNLIVHAVPVDAATCESFMREAWGVFQQHRKWAQAAATAPLNPNQIITY